MFRHQILTLIRRYSFWCLLISLSLISLLIDYRQRIPVLTFARYDDGLFLNLANHIAQGNWLGPYNNLSHVKGPFYPFFMAMSHWLGPSASHFCSPHPKSLSQFWERDFDLAPLLPKVGEGAGG